MLHRFKGDSDVKHISLSMSPAAVCIAVDRPPFIDEAPTNSMRLLSMTTSGRAFEVSRRCSGLADLV
jgi:hypothetical protein